MLYNSELCMQTDVCVTCFEVTASEYNGEVSHTLQFLCLVYSGSEAVD